MGPTKFVPRQKAEEFPFKFWMVSTEQTMAESMEDSLRGDSRAIVTEPQEEWEGPRGEWEEPHGEWAWP